MIWHPGFIKTHFSNARCKRCITGREPSSQQQKKTTVACAKWNKKVNKASQSACMERIHGEPCVMLLEPPEGFLASHQPQEHVINCCHVHKKSKCLMEDCPYQAWTNANFHNNFMCKCPYCSIHITNESWAHWPMWAMWSSVCLPHLPITDRACNLDAWLDYQTESRKTHATNKYPMRRCNWHLRTANLLW